jgi:hypothetical protein
MTIIKKHLKKVFCLVVMLAIAIPTYISAKGNDEIRRGKPTVKCHMKFDLKAWSVFYKSGKGRGAIRCSNGQRAEVKIKTTGGGITFGKSRIEDGKGTFSKVYDISELFGGYAASEAHAGASNSASAQAMTKGDISLSISGTGHGVDLGVAFGKFKISPLRT